MLFQEISITPTTVSVTKKQYINNPAQHHDKCHKSIYNLYRWKFKPNRFLNFRFLYAAFYCGFTWECPSLNCLECSTHSLMTKLKSDKIFKKIKQGFTLKIVD